MIEFVAYATHSDALTCIRECLGTRYRQHVVVGIACHRGLIGSLVGMGEVATEVHGKVGKVFQYDEVIFSGESADTFQFVLVEAYPRRVVGVAIHNTADVLLLYYLLNLVDEGVTTITVYIKSDMPNANHLTLGGLHGESGIDEEHSRFALLIGSEGMMPDGECGKCALHRSCGRNAAQRVDIHSDESLHEFRCCLFDAWNTTIRRIDGGATVGESLLFGLQCYVRWFETRNSHFEVYYRFAGLLFQYARQALYVAYCSFREVAEAHLFDSLGHYIII